MTEIDRLSIRARPSGFPLMHQNWGKLLFMHWRLDEHELRPLVPSSLSIDTFDGSAWIGVVPFTMWGIRASFLPPLPGTSAFHELNVRTYVHFNGVPGVWFFSLDAAHSLAVWGARTFYHLPYFNAEMRLKQNVNRIDYLSARRDQMTYAKFFDADRAVFAAEFESNRNLSPARFEGCWNIGAPLPEAEPGSLQFFLTERYCLYTFHRQQIYQSRIYHDPWRLRTATIETYESNMIESLGVPTPEGPPLLHYAESIAVDIWPLKKVSEPGAVATGSAKPVSQVTREEI